MEPERKKSKAFIYVILIIAVILLGIFLGKGKKDGNVSGDYDIGLADVSSVSIVAQESFPVQILVNVKGTLPDACTEIGEHSQTRSENIFFVKLETRRLKDAQCATVMTDFEESINLGGVVGLPAGVYTVDVNGERGSFILDVDNFITDEDPIK